MVFSGNGKKQNWLFGVFEGNELLYSGEIPPHIPRLGEFIKVPTDTGTVTLKVVSIATDVNERQIILTGVRQ